MKNAKPAGNCRFGFKKYRVINFFKKEFTLNASGFSSGLYMYVLRDGEGKMKSGKLVVE
jgi:hypothetical protein